MVGPQWPSAGQSKTMDEQRRLPAKPKPTTSTSTTTTTAPAPIASKPPNQSVDQRIASALQAVANEIAGGASPRNALETVATKMTD